MMSLSSYRLDVIILSSFVDNHDGQFLSDIVESEGHRHKLSHLIWHLATVLAKCHTTLPFIRVEEYCIYCWRTKQMTIEANKSWKVVKIEIWKSYRSS